MQLAEPCRPVRIYSPTSRATDLGAVLSVATLYGTLSPNYLSAPTWAITAPRPVDLHKWGSQCSAKPDGHGGLRPFSVAIRCQIIWRFTLLRASSDARIVNVSSGVGSLASNADPSFPYRTIYGPGYAASKTAENAMTLAMMIELEQTNIKINLVSPGFTSTALNNFAGTESVQDGSREVVRVALLGPDGPTNTFTGWEDTTIPW
ncbi:SDR family NAD(P)-dependent oxidoreductase [Nakamurella sp. PAMC28650]|nr:SDR family NAD(P)-dependent oxidoreductase [Nakamurella sp. PAMC28650]